MIKTYWQLVFIIPINISERGKLMSKDKKISKGYQPKGAGMYPGPKQSTAGYQVTKPAQEIPTPKKMTTGLEK